MREQTPPLLKWLLVERATVSGNLIRANERVQTVDRELELAQKRLTQLENEIARLHQQKAQVCQALLSGKERLAALDTAIGIAANDQVAPYIAGNIRAHASEYGKRGNLKAFVVGVLQKSTPTALSTLMLLEMVIEHFGISFATKSERQAFRANTLKRLLLRLKDEGLVEAAHGAGTNDVGLWRWKTSLPPLPAPRLAAAA